MSLQDTLNRSWLRRGWGLGSPTWGMSVPPLWQETQVQFVRRRKALNEYGSFTGEAETLIWATGAHCEIVEVRVQEMSVDFVHGTLFKRLWSIYAPYPDDESLIPHQGDFAKFTTVDGKVIDLQLKHVYVKDNLADHIQIDTTEFE